MQDNSQNAINRLTEKVCGRLGNTKEGVGQQISTLRKIFEYLNSNILKFIYVA